MAETLISELLNRRRRPLLSYEFFPPKDDAGFEALKRVVEDLKPTKPDFVTVTYGAGGSTRERTLEVCRYLQSSGFSPVMHHLTCVGASRADLTAVADQIHSTGIRNIMALRGDPPRGETQFQRHPDGLGNANELVALLKKRHPDFCCGVAAYPEVHQEALSPESDILYLKYKLEAGAAFATTQLFYDNRVFYAFEQKCRAWGIRHPILPGLLPPVSLPQLERMSSMCKASLPPALVKAMKEAGNQGEKAEQAGIDWTVRQIRDLLAHNVPGIHLYVLNRSKAALTPALLDCFGNRG